MRELDLYLEEHGLTTIGRSRCHYYRHNKETVDTDELSSDEDGVESDDEDSESEEDDSDNDFLLLS